MSASAALTYSINGGPMTTVVSNLPTAVAGGSTVIVALLSTALVKRAEFVVSSPDYATLAQNIVWTGAGPASCTIVVPPGGAAFQVTVTVADGSNVLSNYAQFYQITTTPTSAGSSALSVSVPSFIQPAQGGTVTVPVSSSAPLANWVFRSLFGFGTGNGNQYILSAIPDATHITLQNPPASASGSGYIINNSAPGTTILGTTLTTIAPVGRRTGNAISLAGPQTAMCRLFDVALENLPWLRIAWGLWWNNGLVELGQTDVGPVTITASIEYPLGSTRQPMKFGGSAGAVIPNIQTMFSDALVLTTPIPRGGLYAINFFLNSTTGDLPIINVAGHINVAAGEAIHYGGTDQTLSGTVTDTSGGANVITPLAIIGPTSRKTVAVLGDSRQIGTGDTTVNSMNDFGEVPRILGPSAAYIAFGAGGEQAQAFANTAAAHGLRDPLIQLCTHATVAYGVNDLSTGRTEAQLKTDLTTIYTRYNAQNMILIAVTISPETTSTDSWATTTNQTAAAWNATRVSVNNDIRANFSALCSGYIEVASKMETSPGSGIWKAPPSSAFSYTGDGVHANSAAHQQELVYVGNALGGLITQ